MVCDHNSSLLDTLHNFVPSCGYIEPKPAYVLRYGHKMMPLHVFAAVQSVCGWCPEESQHPSCMSIIVGAMRGKEGKREESDILSAHCKTFPAQRSRFVSGAQSASAASSAASAPMQFGSGFGGMTMGNSSTQPAARRRLQIRRK